MASKARRLAPIADDEPLVDEVRIADLRRIKLLERNAQFMRHETYVRLVANIKRDGILTQLPLAEWRGEGPPDLDDLEHWLIRSGNHRAQAALDAGHPIQKVQFLTVPITDDRGMALQLSHNAIRGEEDPAILKELYDEIETVEMREASGLDDKTLELMAEVDVGSLNEAQLDYQTLSILFLPDELVRARAALADAHAATSGADERWAAPLAQFDDMLDALDVSSAALDIRNVATSFALVLAVFQAHVTDLADEYDGESGHWVPCPSVTGWRMPAASAVVVRRAIDRMLARDDAGSPWQALELLCADYLAGD